MSLAKRGSRHITVDARGYRWTVRRKPTYCQGMGWTPLTFAVESAEGTGTVLVVRTSAPHPSNWLKLPVQPVLPAIVAASIRTALHQGWRPDNPGAPLVLDLGDCTG
ncbi:hypothetical protein GCM10010432_26470 [Catellatospora methionotrophica]